MAVFWVAAVAVLIVACPPSPVPSPTPPTPSNEPAAAQTALDTSTSRRIEAISARVRRILVENVVPFWVPHSLDHDHGGYHLAPERFFPPAGGDGGENSQPPPPTDALKTVVAQTRMMWFFARLARAPQFSNDFRRHCFTAAQHGFVFLRDRLWDATFNGVIWATDHTGSTIVHDQKDLYGHAFALFALSEFIRAGTAITTTPAPAAEVPTAAEMAAITADVENAKRLAEALIDCLATHFHDPQHGGFREVFPRDWTPPTAHHVGYIGRQSPREKTMNAHLHLLEALSAFLRTGPSSSSPSASANRHATMATMWLRETLGILTHHVVRQPVGACTDRHTENWAPIVDPTGLRVSYGHDLEAAWMIDDALAVLDPTHTGPAARQAAEQAAWKMAEAAWEFGFDPTHGGVFASGPLGESADRREKVWWGQAEALLAAVWQLQVVIAAGNPATARLERIERLLEWIENRQMDRDGGEWHATVHPNGQISGPKVGAWKTAYHTSRALIETLDRLAPFCSTR